MSLRILRQFRQCFSGHGENHLTESHVLAFHMLSRMDFEPLFQETSHENVHRTILFTVSTRGQYYNYEFKYYRFYIKDLSIDVSKIHKDTLVDELVCILFKKDFIFYGILPIIVDKITPEYVDFAICDELLDEVQTKTRKLDNVRASERDGT